MFDFESAAGQVFIKDSESRLESYIWTDTGINLTICDINNDTDLGTYEGDVGIGSENELKAIQVKEIFGQSFTCLLNLFHFSECNTFYFVVYNL